MDFPEAVNRLFPLNGSAEQAGCGLQPKKPKPKPTPDPPLSAKQKKLLARVVAFYHTAFGEDPRAREYLKSRGITDNAVLSAHKAGFANGTLLNVLPVADPANGGDDGDLIDRLKEIGIPNQRGKDPVTGKLKTEENTVEGPLMVFITTTAVEIDGETASRFVFISIDETVAMTEKILAKQRQRHTMAGMLSDLSADAVIEKHRNANRLLAPMKVVNPYAELLTFTSKSLRARRDHTKYLNLISAVAYLFQHRFEERAPPMSSQGKGQIMKGGLHVIDRRKTVSNRLRVPGIAQ